MRWTHLFAFLGLTTTIGISIAACDGGGDTFVCACDPVLQTKVDAIESGNDATIATNTAKAKCEKQWKTGCTCACNPPASGSTDFACTCVPSNSQGTEDKQASSLADAMSEVRAECSTLWNVPASSCTCFCDPKSSGGESEEGAPF